MCQFFFLGIFFWPAHICFSSTLRSRSRSGLYLSDDYNNLSPRMNRSRSMSRLHLNASQELDPGLTSSLRARPFELSLRHLKDNLDDSENRRVVLVHKLKEAQETLEVCWWLNIVFFLCTSLIIIIVILIES